MIRSGAMEDDESVASSFWDFTEQTSVVTKQKVSFIYRLIPDIIFILVNLGSLFYVVTSSDITPGNRLGSLLETSIAFLGGFFGFFFVYLAFRYGLIIQAAYFAGDIRAIYRSLICFGRW